MSRILLLVVGVWLGSLPVAQASSEIIYGTGYEYGYCDGSWFSSCAWNLQRQAEDRGRSDTVFRCQMRGGTMQSFTPFCSTSCNPSWLPHDAPSTYVSCQSNCNGQCDLPN